MKKSNIEYKIKRPLFIVFTDKDGTLNLKDEELKIIFPLITELGGILIPITGRTVGDIKESLENSGLDVPEILIGDNGANIYSVSRDKFLVRKNLEHEKVMSIIKCFLENGGNLDYIRYTDGKNIFASSNTNIKQYYRDSKIANFNENILHEINNTQDITKVTLAGKKELINKIKKYTEELGFWTDMDKTKFPNKEEQNYRLDIADKNINKGEAVRTIISHLMPKYGYICIGNGYNDMSMFKQAINDGMTAAVMGDSDIELIREVKNYAKHNSGKVTVIPNTSNLANRYILKVAKVFETYIKTRESNNLESQKITKSDVEINRENSDILIDEER